MIAVVALGVLLFAAVTLSGCCICLALGVPMPWESAPDDGGDLEPARRDHKPVLRKCGGCGVIYHVSWGRFCPDCTGAD